MSQYDQRGQKMMYEFDASGHGERAQIESTSSAVAWHDCVAVPPCPAPRGGLAPWQIERAKETMMSDLETTPTLHCIAAACGLSASHFSRAFRRSVGIPPLAWLSEQRIATAKRLIDTTDTVLADIAITCGFADQSHFTRVFSRVMGVSPGVWRRLSGLPKVIR